MGERQAAAASVARRLEYNRVNPGMPGEDLVLGVTGGDALSMTVNLG